MELDLRTAWTYTGVWICFCLLAAGLAWRGRATIALFDRAYWRLLLQPWKVLTFAVAASGLVMMAPYTGDPTWDHVDASFMAALTFLTAPWSVAVLYKVVRKQLPPTQGYLALCVLLFSASWSYDLYLLLRDGAYPITWLANLIASTTLYVAAGLFWNLAWNEERGQFFAFWEPSWPAVTSESRFSQVALPAVLFMAVISAVMMIFLVPYLGRVWLAR